MTDFLNYLSFPKNLIYIGIRCVAISEVQKQVCACGRGDHSTMGWYGYRHVAVVVDGSEAGMWLWQCLVQAVGGCGREIHGHRYAVGRRQQVYGRYNGWHQ